MRIKKNTVYKWILAIVLAFSASVAVAMDGMDGGNTDGGGSPFSVRTGALTLLIQGGGLKRAMLNYLHTLPLEKIEDPFVRTKLSAMIQNDSLERDIRESNYVLATPNSPCLDAYDQNKPASTQVGRPGADVCFDVDKLAKEYRGMNDEEMMVNLASLAFHEHTHHYQNFSKSRIEQNEYEANRIAGYLLITAKFVKLPLLAWFQPASGPAQFQVIQSMYQAIRAKEQAFIAPTPADYAQYPGYQGQTDRGIVRLLPREKYDGKLSIQGGGSYYSFTRLTHEYGDGSDIGFERNELMVGFAGCDFGQFVDLGQIPLNAVNLKTPALHYLVNFRPAVGEPAIRKQQDVALYYGVQVDGWNYKSRVKNIRVGETFALRSIDFDQSDVLVAFRVVRIDKDGSVIIAWKRLKQFATPSCQ